MVKIHWESAPTTSQAERDSYGETIKALGLPLHKGTGRLAIVGGGPSIADHIDELKVWDGTIWAVNGTINWFIERDIDAWFYTADATSIGKWTYDLSRVRKAILAPDCSPDLVHYLLDRGALVTLTAPVQSGPTSVNAADFLSLHAGYNPMTYFGCEGSFRETTHAFQSADIADWMDVDVGGKLFRTKAEFVSQSIMLSNTIREFPAHYSEKSGGLLRAMLEHGHEYDVYQVSNSLFAKLKDAA